MVFMRLLKDEILANKKYGENLYKMDVFSPYICKNVRPGNFINVKCSSAKSMDPLLRRPFSIYEVDRQFNVFSILYIIKGRGTQYLKSLKKGEQLDFLGPLGNSFKVEKNVKDYILVGGGIGIAPLFYISKELIDCNKNVFFIAGFKDNTFYRWERDLIKIINNYRIFTEDGSYGQSGRPLDYISANIGDFKEKSFIICGPRNMLKALKSVINGKCISAFVIMEERMACGMGTCMGCAIKTIDAGGHIEYKRVCLDGPIFDLSEVVFD